MSDNMRSEACLALGNLGEQIPSVFHHPSDPDVSLTPNSTSEDRSAPLACLLEAFDDIKRETLDGDAGVDPLIWRDAMLVTTKAIAARAVHVFADARLEHTLLPFLFLFGSLGTAGARNGNERSATITAYGLGELADGADHPFFHEYPQDIAMDLVEIGLFAEEKGLLGYGGPLAAWIGETLTGKLRSHLSHPMHEALVAGQFTPASQDARWAFIKRVGMTAGENFGFRFDPATGADYPPPP